MLTIVRGYKKEETQSHFAPNANITRLHVDDDSAHHLS